MTMNERRAAWRQYYLAALVDHDCDDPDTYADSMLAAEDAAFGADDTTGLHAALASTRAHALEQQTRAENAEMALRQAQHVIRMLKEDDGPSVPVADLGFLLSELRTEAERVPNSMAKAFHLVLHDLVRAARQRAVAKPAEGGEP